MENQEKGALDMLKKFMTGMLAPCLVITFTPPVHAFRDKLVDTAQTYIGLPYRWGACTINGPNDCSGLVVTVYELNGLDVPRTSREQYQSGTPIEKQELEKGDLVFFSTKNPGHVSHVGIYIGNDRFIHASSTGKAIREGSLSNEYYSNHFYGACTYLR